MGYRVTADRTQIDQMRAQYAPRTGLEGPFNYSGRVLYYDTKEGAYYDPVTDYYVGQDEMAVINGDLIERLTA